MKDKVLIAGGSGLIGGHLSEALQKRDVPYAILSRNPNKIRDGRQTFRCRPGENYIEEGALRNVSKIVNLCGVGIADKKWTPFRKREIISSRVVSTRFLGELLSSTEHHVERLINASAVGFYGNTGQSGVDESSAAGEGFLAESVQAWEEAFQQFTPAHMHRYILRIGIVLSPDGGILDKMRPGLKFGIVPFFGKGLQMMSWIHAEDLVGMILELLGIEKETTLHETGINSPLIINAVTPNPVSNKHFAKSLKKIKKSPFPVLPVPAFLLRMGMGEMAEMLLDSSDVKNGIAAQYNFNYQYPRLEGALAAT